MSTDEKARFAHRLTENSRFESICLQCFRTAGDAELESGLEAIEGKHVCAEEDVICLYGRKVSASVRVEERKQDLA